METCGIKLRHVETKQTLQGGGTVLLQHQGHLPKQLSLLHRIGCSLPKLRLMVAETIQSNLEAALDVVQSTYCWRGSLLGLQR